MTLVGQAAVAVEAPPERPAVTTSSQLVHIGTGDQIRIEVFNVADLTTTTAVAADGTIRLPLIGAVKIIGTSPTEAQELIEAAYRDGEILVDPHITVTVMQSSSQRVSVTGEVRNQGRYPVETSTTVLDLITLAGGITEKGSDIVDVIRGTQRFTVDLRNITTRGSNTAPAVTPQGGDTIHVPKSVYIVNGPVGQPGEFPLKGEVDLALAIARAGGLTPLGSSSRIVIRRRTSEDKYVELKVNLKGKKTTRIERDDVIIVKERIL